MQRYVSTLAFVLGFVGVMALAAGGTWPAVSGQDSNNGGAPGAQRILLPGNPSHTSFGTLGADGNYHGVASPDSDLTPEVISPAGNPSHTSFGTEMPDGTYCGVCVP
ncbi:MAG TPA: hypothetical protein VGK07_11550, partial [Candidatus Limnocylindria bacterium]